MTTTWTEVFLSAIVCAGVMFIPGALIAGAGRVPHKLALVAAPLLTATVVVFTAVLTPRLGIAWGVGPLIGVTALGACIALCAGLITRTLRKRVPMEEATQWAGSWWLLIGALILSSGVHLYRLVHAFVRPYALSQTYDSPFHQNLVESMMDRGDASFLHVALTVYGSDSGFYPALWHEIVTLVVSLTGISIPGATNAMIFVVTGLLWPLGVALLLGWMLRSWNGAALGALFALCLAQMPNHFTFFGVLYPNLLAYSMIPFMLALGVVAFLNGPSTPEAAPAFAIALAALPGLAIAHPSGMISFVVLVLPLLLCGVWVKTREWVRGPGLLAAASPYLAVATVLAVYAFVNWVTMKVPSLAHMRINSTYWGPIGGPIGGLGRGLSFTAGWSFREGGPIPVILGVIALVGGIYALRQVRTAWLPATHLISLTLYVVSYSVSGEIRPYLVGLWYSDIQRLAALTGVTGAPLVALGFYALLIALPATSLRESTLSWKERLSSVFRSAGGHGTTSETLTGRARYISVFAAFACFVGAQFSGTLNDSYAWIKGHMDFDTSELNTLGILSLDEYRLIERLPEQVPEDATLIGNPWNGSTFAPALSGLEFAFPHVAYVYDEEAHYVSQHLNEALTDPKVCDIVNARKMFYVLDFGTDYLWGGDVNGSSAQFPGLRVLVESGVAEVVDQQGNAKLLRVTACR